MNANHVYTAAFTLGALLIVLLLWKVIFQYTDWAVLALLPIIYILFTEQRKLRLSINRAEINTVLEENSPLREIFTGRFSSITVSTIFVLVSIPVLAWQAETSNLREVATLVTLCFVTSFFYLYMPTVVSLFRYRKPFAESRAVHWGAYILAIPFVLFLAYDIWDHVEIPDELREAGFWEWVISQVKKKPDRGFITLIFSYIHGYEAALLKLAVYSQEIHPRVGPVLYCINYALVSIVIAKTSILLTRFAQKFNYLWSPREVESSEGQQDTTTESQHDAKLKQPFPWKWIGPCIVAALIIFVAFLVRNITLNSKPSYDLPCEKLEWILREATNKPLETEVQDIILEELLNPLLIPPNNMVVSTYADFHYSLSGDPVEIEEASQSDMNESIRERILGAYSKQFSYLPIRLDEFYVMEYTKAIDKEIKNVFPDMEPPLVAYTSAMKKVAENQDGKIYRHDKSFEEIKENLDIKHISSKITEHLKEAFTGHAEDNSYPDNDIIIVGKGGGVHVCTKGRFGCITSFRKEAHIEQFMQQAKFESVLRNWISTSWKKEVIIDERRKRQKQIMKAMKIKAKKLRENSDLIFEETEDLLRTSGFSSMPFNSCKE